jgi:argininosuccinate lyase
MVMALKGLPSGYNKDLQDDKRALFDAVDVMSLVLPAVAGAVDELTFRTDRMRAAVTSVMMATDLADYLVRRGVTFRESHGAVGSLVRQAEEARVELHELPLTSFKAAHAQFGDDVLDALSAQASVDCRSVPGGTAVSAVREQLLAAHEALEPPDIPPGNEFRLEG